MRAVPQVEQRSQSHGPIYASLRLAAGLVALALPILSAWILVASGLFLGLPLFLAVSGMVLVLLGLPLLWDHRVEKRMAMKSHPPPRILSRADRIRLRILTLSFLSLLLLLSFAPSFVAPALRAEGGWISFGDRGAFSRDLEDFSFWGAEKIERLALSLRREPLVGGPSGMREASGASGAQLGRFEKGMGLEGTGGHEAWPFSNETVKIVRVLPKDMRDLDLLAERIMGAERQEFGRAKAVYDFVSTRLKHARKGKGLREPIRAEEILGEESHSRKAYALLMVALGEKVGIPMALLSGRIRENASDFSETTHYWVGMEIGGKGFLADPWLGSGQDIGERFYPSYASAYFMTPPEIFAYDHLPNDPSWSLLPLPPSEEDIAREPLLTARFFQSEMRMKSPFSEELMGMRGGELRLDLENPKGKWVFLEAFAHESGKLRVCAHPSREPMIEVSCHLEKGPWDVSLYEGTKPEGPFVHLATVKVESP